MLGAFSGGMAIHQTDRDYNVLLPLDRDLIYRFRRIPDTEIVRAQLTAEFGPQINEIIRAKLQAASTNQISAAASSPVIEPQ